MTVVDRPVDQYQRERTIVGTVGGRVARSSRTRGWRRPPVVGFPHASRAGDLCVRDADQGRRASASLRDELVAHVRKRSARWPRLT